MTVFHILILHDQQQFTSAVKTEQPEVVPLYIVYLTMVVLFFVYIDKMRILLES